MNAGIKYGAAIVGVPILAVVIYLGAVVQVYVLAWVLEGLGLIF